MPWSGSIRLFDADPDLLQQVPEEERALAVRSAAVPALRASLGPWDPSAAAQALWGVLVVEGTIVREVGVAGSTAAELLGTGDLVLVGGDAGVEPIVPMGSAWTVIEPATLAVLDDHFQPALRRWPGLAACLLERAERRADRLSMAQAISHLTRVDARVLMILWLLADRWGRVTNNGLVVPLRLTHRILARLTGARRPSVTTAVSQLTERGLVSRRQDGSWVVYGAPPDELDRVGIEPLPAQPAPPRRSPRGAPAALAEEGELFPRVAAVAEIRRRLATDIPRLAAAYEAQRDRTAAVTEQSREARERSRRLRETLN